MVVEKRDKCRFCSERAPSQKSEPIAPEEIPEAPFDDVCIDFFACKGKAFLSQVCRFSGWPTITLMGKTTFPELEKVLLRTMCWSGVPKVYESDGGSPFQSGEFRKFCEKWGIRHRMASAGYPESNGRAELGVKSAKRMVLENMKEDGSLDTEEMVTAFFNIVTHL